VDWLVIFGQFDYFSEIALRSPRVLESLPEQMPFEIEGVRKIRCLMEQIIH
jgi:hypothetical protein